MTRVIEPLPPWPAPPPPPPSPEPQLMRASGDRPPDKPAGPAGRHPKGDRHGGRPPSKPKDVPPRKERALRRRVGYVLVAVAAAVAVLAAAVGSSSVAAHLWSARPVPAADRAAYADGLLAAAVLAGLVLYAVVALFATSMIGRRRTAVRRPARIRGTRGAPGAVAVAWAGVPHRSTRGLGRRWEVTRRPSSPVPAAASSP